MFDSRQLEYIIAIAEEESLSKAADRLFISQSALSQQLDKLYKQKIPQLFYYENKKMKLTSAGKIYVNGARAILKVKELTENQIEEIKNETVPIKTLRILVPEIFNELIYREIIPVFGKKYSSTVISVSSNERIDTINKNADEYDFILLPQAAELENYSHFVIPHQSLGLICAGFATMPLPIFLPSQDDMMMPIVRSALNHWRMSLPVYAYGSNTDMIMKQVIQGLCCYAADYRSLNNYPELLLYTGKSPFTYSLYVYYRDELSNTGVYRHMTELLKKSFGK